MNEETPACSGCGYPRETNEHGENCQVNMIQHEKDPHGPEAIRADIRHKAEKIRSWAEELGLEEGRDYLVIESTSEATGNDYKTAPHEAKSFAVGVLEPHYKQFREYILGDYKNERKQENPDGDVRLYYSWGGRFLVGWDDTPFDTVAMESVDPPRVPTHHEKFKKFFKDNYDFDFPTAETLNPILTEISRNGRKKYEKALQELKSRQKKETLPDDGYGLIDSLEHALIILDDAQNGEALTELPETIEGSMRDKMAHYADLTYNAGSAVDCGRVAEITGVDFPDKIRLDRLFSRWDFDGNKMEQVCHDFADYLDKNGR